MALHTRGNQPSIRRSLNTVDDVFTVPTTNEDVVEIGTVVIIGTVEIDIPNIEEHNAIILLNEPQ